MRDTVFPPGMDFRARCRELLAAFPGVAVAGIGDVMLDQYRRGTATGLSPEAPAVELLNPGLAESPGGAANVARNAAALGGQVWMVGVIGQDREGAALRTLLDATPRVTLRFVTDESRPTTLKLRFYHGPFQILRVSQEVRQHLAEPVAGACRDALLSVLDDADVLFVQDYGKGVVCPRVISVLRALRRERPGLQIVFDPKLGNHRVYAPGMCTVLKPNWREAVVLADGEPESADRPTVAARLAERYDCNVLITLGQDGVFFHERSSGWHEHVPTRSREAFDVAGAGDTALAAASLALAAGGSLFDAALFANVAGGLVVEKSGTATVTAAEVLQELDHPATVALLARASAALPLREAQRNPPE